tara:strand:- start:17 stop:526 length:510 start_codon:yes stop_codon:yes gene_type:complete
MDTINFKGKEYPEFQSNGNFTRFAEPYAKELCKALPDDPKGFDIGCNRPEWAFPNSTIIDTVFDDEWDAFNLPYKEAPYIFSSHCLEHIPRWFDALEYWTNCLKNSGTLFLYLPSYSQEYWRPWNNRKHNNIFTPEIIKDALLALGYKNVFVGEPDLNNSFMAVGEKCK